MKTAKDRIVFPLDLPTTEAAMQYVRRLSGTVGLFKIGLELFIRGGPEIVGKIQAAGGVPIFLDLKLHDIPTTVRRAMKRVADLGVRFVTVHCGESPEMLAAAVEGAAGKTGVLGVTVLTSVSQDHLRRVGYGGDLEALVRRRAEMAREAGCAGVVCSALEAADLKVRFGSDFLCVTPGIRPEWTLTASDDQARVVTPARAVAQGADYLVVGRPIRDAADPRQAAVQLAAEIEGAG